MQLDKNPFSVSTIDLQNSKVLIRSEQAEAAKGKIVVIGEKHTITADENILSREVVVEKTADGKESLKITIKAPTLEGQAQAKIAEETVKQPEAPQSVRPVSHIGQTGLRVPRWQRTFKPKSPERGRWKIDERSSQYKKFRAKPTFDLLLNKYTR
jgi:hypothetical protein